MSTVVKQFIYTGTLQLADIPIGVSSIDIHIWGGGGGIGGKDQSGDGADAAAGHFVSKTGLDMTSYDGVKTMVVAVGGGGGSGMSGRKVDGGINGKSMTGYSGGNGGESGEINISGSGGGGGGATTITLFESGQTLNNIELAIAGGGGGSGGSGGASRGGTGINTNSATAHTPDSLGEEGADHPYDGGGGGAGGGGADGGKGASAGRGDAGGEGGWSGSNLVPSSGSEDNGTGITPGGTGNAYYTGSVAVGGTSTVPTGGDGKAVIVFNIPAEARNKVSGTWKSVPQIYRKISGTWKKLIGGYVKVSGVWKPLFSSDIIFTAYATGFGNASGGTTSGSVGTNETPTASTIPVSAPYIEGGGGNYQPVAAPAQDWTTDQAWFNQQEPMPYEHDGGQDGSQSGKGIVCTSMYQTTGLEDWKRAMAIWRLYHKKVLGDEKEVQEGYHWTFKPYVRGMRKNKVLRFIGAWLARHVTNHMKTKLYKRGIDKTDAPFKHNFRKTDITGKVILAVSEPILWTVGRVLKMLNMDKGEQ